MNQWDEYKIKASDLAVFEYATKNVTADFLQIVNFFKIFQNTACAQK